MTSQQNFRSTISLIQKLGDEVQTSSVWWRDEEGLECPFTTSEQMIHMIKIYPKDPLTRGGYEDYVGWWMGDGGEDYPELDNRYTNYNLP
jgi:hypothetical protein